jgi:transcriptional antiterminator RfaH
MTYPNQSLPWYVIHTHPRRELLVTSLLSRYDELTFFLPEVLQHRRGERQLVPLFPGYLFVQLDLTSSAAGKLIHTPGVIGLVGSERQPLPVAAETVSAIQEQVVRVNAQGGLSPHPFSPGDPVVIKSGPLQGLDAVFVGPLHPTQRVQVLLHFLGQEQQVTVEASLLEKANLSQQAPVTPRPRRTRGHGRQIHVRP